METLVFLLSIATRFILSKSSLVHQLIGIILFNNTTNYNKTSSISSQYIANKFNIESNISYDKISTEFTELNYINSNFSRFINMFVSESQNNNISLIVFALIDIVNAKLLDRLYKLNYNYINKKGKMTSDISNTNATTNNKESSVSNILLFFLFNPLTILCCLEKHLSCFYILAFLIIAYLKTDLLFQAFFVGLFTYLFPKNIFLYFNMLIYSIYLNYYKGINEKIYNRKKNLILMLISYTLLSIIIILILSFNYNSNNYFGFLSVVERLYRKSETYPNSGILWGILNQTFLKFTNFSVNISIMYTTILNYVVLYLFIKALEYNYVRKDNSNTSLEDINITNDNSDNNNNRSSDINNKKNRESNSINTNFSVYLMLVYTINSICDWVPCEMDTIVIMCLVYQIKNEYDSFWVKLPVSNINK